MEIKRQKATITEQDSRRQDMTIGIAFNLLMVAVDRKAVNRKKVPQARTVEEETINTELTVTTKHLNCKIMRP